MNTMGDGNQIQENRRPTQGQLALVRALPDNDKVNWTPETWTVPVAPSFGEQRFEAEQTRIFNRMALPAGPAGLAPENGSYVCRTVYGKEVIFTRDTEGEFHAFLNVCQHRGSRIVIDQETHRGKLLSCPFHAWGYDLKGRLAAVPREETFGKLDKSSHGLPKLQCRELGGLIWLKMDPEADDDFSTVPVELIADLEALGLPTMHLFATGMHDMEADWKLPMDTFQEGYHVVRLHAATLKGRFEDSLEIVDMLGLHIRRVSGRIGYRRDQLEDKDHSLAELRKLVTFHYTLFPSAVLICSQIYVNLMVFMPISPTSCRVVNYMLTDRPPTTEKEFDRFTRSHELTDKVTFQEDFAAAVYGQAGISTGALKELTLCPLERHVWTFHTLVDEMVKGRDPATAAAAVAG